MVRLRNLLCTLLIAVFMVSMVAVLPTSASSTTLSVEPSSIIDTDLGPGETFSVNVTITDVVDLGGYEFKLGYDTTVLNATAITLGDFAETFTKTWTKKINDAEGWLHYSVSLPIGSPLPGVTGNGTLATINFTVADYGATVLDLYGTGLINSDGLPISHVVYDGLFSNVGYPPVAIFTISPDPPYHVGDTLTFDASASHDPDGTIVSYEWDFGDGNITTVADPVMTHIYRVVSGAGKAGGTYNVKLTVTDNQSLTNTATADVRVLAHDVRVTSVAPDLLKALVGENITISVDIANEGDFTENFNVTVYANEIAIETQSVTLEGDATTTPSLEFIWDTTGFARGEYTISANATVLESIDNPEGIDDDPTDNTLVDGTVTLQIHDIAVTSVTASPITVMPGDPVTINVTVVNQGTETETFNVTILYDSTDIETKTVTDLAPGGPETLSFTWDTTGVPLGIYKIKAVAEVSDDYNLTNNEFIDGTVTMIRDIAITDVDPLPTTAMPGIPVKINVTVANLGTRTETFDVNTYANETLIETKPDRTLVAGDSEILTFTWNTAGLSEGDYTIKANATILPEEYNTTNNELIYGTVSIKPYNSFSFEKSVGGVTFKVYINTTSIVSDFTYSSTDKEVSFKATAVPGLEGLPAWWNVTIPKALLDGSFIVLIDGDDVAFTPTLNATHTSLYFIYTLSLRHIQIRGTIAAIPPVASFTPSKTEAYVNELITFNASASYDPDTISVILPKGNITSYEWDFGDGTITTVYDPIITYTYKLPQNFTYQIRLTVTDNHTIPLKDTYNDTVTITALKPVANFTASKTKAYVNEVITFNASASYDPDLGSIVRYEWNFGDETIVTETDPITTHNYTAAGRYTVTLTVTDNQNLTGTHKQHITIEKLSSTISISASPTTLLASATTTISGSITPLRARVEVTIWYWPKGDPLEWRILKEVTTDDNSQYSYDWTPKTAGTYELKASWVGDAATSYATSDVITIEVVEIHDITIDVGGVSFHVITESNSTVSDFQLIPKNKEIQFDVTGLDGTVGYCNVTIPITLLGGPYTVRVDGLLITPEKTTNGTHSFLYFTYSHSTQTVKIKGTTLATSPIALFTPSTTSVYVGHPITFNGSASYDPDGDITSYEWNFGDGTSEIYMKDVNLTDTATNTYTSSGEYTVSLTVTDNDDLTDTATTNVTVLVAVHDIAVTSVTALPTTVTVGESISINVTVANEGDVTETFNVTAYYNENILDTQTDITLSAGNDTTLTFPWDTTNVPPSNYTISAKASVVPNETDTANNERIDGTVEVKEAPSVAPVILYVAAVVAIVFVIATIVIYFVRFRKS